MVFEMIAFIMFVVYTTIIAAILITAYALIRIMAALIFGGRRNYDREIIVISNK